MDRLLEIKHLSITYRGTRGKRIAAVNDLSLSLARGKSLGLVGESGSGKSTVGAAVMGLLPRNAEITGGEIVFDGRDLLLADAEYLRQTRWKRIAMIFQAAMNALNPIQRVGDQIVEAIRIHEPETPEADARERVRQLYDQMGIPENRLRHYPHQYSGGMRQRAVIAMALACRPQLIIADEPTTALDVIVQDQILKTIAELQQALALSILFISHDIAVVADVCHHVGVMYAGRIVEIGPCRAVLESPGHPYTRALLDAHITLTDEGRHASAPTTGPAESASAPAGCCYAPRCPQATAACRTGAPQWLKRSGDHWIRCPDACERP